MFKRISALLLAACLGLALFACGKSGQTGLRPGEYTGTGNGHGGPIEVRLVIDKEGRIARAEVLSQSETPDYASHALEALPKAIAKTQNLGIDAVAGATLSSNGILAAAAEAIAKAGGDPKDFGFRTVGEQADTTEIVFAGLAGGDFTLTGAQLKNDFELTELDALSINSKGTEKWVHAKGVLLKTILSAKGLSLDDYDSAEASADDGYNIMLPGEVLRGRDILLAFEANGEEIAPRLVVPEERAMYWVKFVTKIEFAGNAPAEPVTSEISLADLIEKLKPRAEDYKHYDAMCKALPVSLLLDEIAAQPAPYVTIQTKDGLCKTERWDIFTAQLLVIDGTPEAPLYTGPDLPAGMRMKYVTSIQIGGVLLK